MVDGVRILLMNLLYYIQLIYVLGLTGLVNLG